MYKINVSFSISFFYHWYHLTEMNNNSFTLICMNFVSVVVVQFLVMSDSLWPHGLQYVRPLCPSPSSRICPSSCPLHQWCHLAISSSDVLLSFCSQSFPASETFSNESAVYIRWPNYWSFNFSISPSNDYSGLIFLKMDWFDFTAVQGTPGVFFSTTFQRHQFFGALPSLRSSSHKHMWPLGRPHPWLYGPFWTE